MCTSTHSLTSRGARHSEACSDAKFVSKEPKLFSKNWHEHPSWEFILSWPTQEVNMFAFAMAHNTTLGDPKMNDYLRYCSQFDISMLYCNKSNSLFISSPCITVSNSYQEALKISQVSNVLCTPILNEYRTLKIVWCSCNGRRSFIILTVKHSLCIYPQYSSVTAVIRCYYLLKRRPICSTLAQFSMASRTQVEAAILIRMPRRSVLSKHTMWCSRNVNGSHSIDSVCSQAMNLKSSNRQGTVFVS